MKKYIPRKIFLLVAVCILLFITICPALGRSYGVNVMIDGQYLVFPEGYGQPFISDEGRTMVPVRGVAEAYGCTVQWDGPNYQAIVTLGEHYVIIPINKRYIDTDSGRKQMDTYARIIEERTYLPIRYIMEAVGADVSWDASSATVIISHGTDVSQPEPGADHPLLQVLKDGLQTHGSYDSSLGYVYQEKTSVNSSLLSRLVYDPSQNQVYVQIEMDLDGSSGNTYSSLRLMLNSPDSDTAYYTFATVNSGTAFNWSGHFSKGSYTNSDTYVIDVANSAVKDIRASRTLNHLVVYQSGLAIQAVDSFSKKYNVSVRSADLGFSS